MQAGHHYLRDGTFLAEIDERDVVLASTVVREIDELDVVLASTVVRICTFLTRRISSIAR